MSNRTNNFDLIRLLAAAQVVFIHAIGHTDLLVSSPPWMRRVLDLVIMFPGVAVFFVISGFLVARSYERLRGNPRAFLWHRALRIYPALLACLAVSLAVLAVFGFLGWEVLGSTTFWAWLAGQLTCGQFYNPEFFRGFGVGVVNGALWTISVELQFYVLLPLLYALAYPLVGRTRLHRLLVPALFLLSFCSFWLVDIEVNGIGGFREAPIGAKLLFISIIPHLWMFILGIVLHRHFDRVRGLLEGRFLFHFAAYTALAAVRNIAIGRDSPWSGLFYLGYLPERILLATMTISAAYSARRLSGRLLGGVDVSYGVYIYHFLIINVFIELGWMQSLWSVAGVFVLAGIAGAASWFGVEKRALALKSAVARPAAAPALVQTETA